MVDLPEVLKKARAVRTATSTAQAHKVMRVIIAAREGGAYTLQAIADYLNSASIPTPLNKSWSRTSVSRVINKSEGHLS